MLFRGISVISASAAALAFCFTRKLYLIPAAFIVCFTAMVLLWALSCVICTAFVNKEKPCKSHNPVFRFYADCIIDSLLQLLRVKLHVSGEQILPLKPGAFKIAQKSEMPHSGRLYKKLGADYEKRAV